MLIAYLVIVGVLCLAAGLSLTRLWRGPSVPDRAVALDVLLVVLISGIGVYAAYYRENTVLPILLVVGLLGFVGSVSLARFASARDRER